MPRKVTKKLQRELKPDRKYQSVLVQKLINKSKKKKKKLMQSNNPTVIPRNYIVENAIKAAVNNNDYSVINKFLEALKNPYDYSNISEEYSKIPEVPSCPYKTYCGT